jgi:hypothetical protein
MVTGAALAMLVAAAPAAAQVIGTFTWRTEPHCNVLSLTVVQQGSVYQLNGVDDLCGAGPVPVTGTATLTASSVVLGFTVSATAGRSAHITAVVSPGTFDGTWTDGEGGGGAFTFNPTAASGSPRPEPASRVLSATVVGTLRRGVGAVSVSRTGFVYRVTFNRDISACAVTASVGGATPNSFQVMFAVTTTVASDPRAVAVHGFTANGLATLIDFHLVVVCP